MAEHRAIYCADSQSMTGFCLNTFTLFVCVHAFAKQVDGLVPDLASTFLDHVFPESGGDLHEIQSVAHMLS